MIAIRKLWASPRMLALADQLIVSASSFLTTLIAARQLPVDDFGRFSLALIATLFAANMHRAILTQPMNVLGAAEAVPQLASRMLGLLRAHVFAIPLATVFLVALSYKLFPDLGLLLAVVFYMASYFLQELLRRYWYVRGQMKRALFNDMISYGGQVLLIVVAQVLWGLSAGALFAIMAVTSLLAFVIGLYKIDLPHPVEHQPLGLLMSQHWGIAKWLILTVLAVWGAGQVYPFLIASLGPAVVAMFSASKNILNIVGILVQSFNNYLPGRAALLLKQQGKHALRKHMVATVVQASLAALVLYGTMMWVAQPLLHLLYGGTYDHAAHLLKILTLGASCTILGAALGAYSLAMEDSRSNFLSNLGATAMTFTVGLWLIREHGVEGAAIATSLSLATAMLLQAMFVTLRYRRLPEAVGHA